jgi:hypothetical protein
MTIGLLQAYFQDVMIPVIKQNDMDLKTHNVAVHKDKLMKANLSSYVKGTNATGRMCHSYKPRNTLNGSFTARTFVNCCIILYLPMLLSQSSILTRADGKCFYQQRHTKSSKKLEDDESPPPKKDISCNDRN